MALILLLTLTFAVCLEGKPDLTLDDVTAVVGENFQYPVGNPDFLGVYRINKVVERGQRKLPYWLHYSKNSSMLTGTPQFSDMGSYTIKLRAECIDPAKTPCQEKISRTFHVNVVEPLKSEESRGSHVVHMHVGNDPLATNRKPAAPDQPPSVQNSIDHLIVIVGRYFQYIIPKSTFMDREDGNTRNLSLNISLVFGKQLPADSWLMFDPDAQMLYGIALEEDVNGNGSLSVINRFILVATDSQGQSAKDVISITYRFEKDVTHEISLNFNSSYFGVLNRAYLLHIAQTIAKFFGDEDLRFLTFLEPKKDSLVRPIVWGNNSLFDKKCYREEIEGLFGKIVYGNDTVRETFAVLFQTDPVLSADLFYSGVCMFPVTTLPAVTKSPIAGKDSDSMWIEIILPALVAILVIVIIALLLLICCRHRKPSKRVPETDKPMFLEDRRPIIFPEELEMLDPSVKPKDPLVLPADYLQETPPAVPPHGRPTPPYRAANPTDNDFIGDDTSASSQAFISARDHPTDPPPYRLPPPYFNPHRVS